jgi:dCTP deaminase
VDPPHGDPARHDQPFEPVRCAGADGHKIVSCGTSSYGYTFAARPIQGVHQHLQHGGRPEEFRRESFVDIAADVSVLRTASRWRARWRFRIPRNVLTICLGKAPTARCGIIVNVTPFEPEWRVS